MKPERWKQVDELLEAALECPAAERASFIDRACAGDEELRRELESLLISDRQVESVIESPPARVAADLFAHKQSKPERGERIAHYEILELIGSGGMGEVYLAQDTRLPRKVALKLLPPSFTHDPQVRARFFREAQLASALDHPNICTIHEMGQSSSFLFIAMQYVEGTNLKQIVDSKPLTLDALLSISLQAADALATAHDRGIIHRDIKSNNIIITPRGQVKVLDFGLAKLVDRGRLDRTLEPELTSLLTRTGAVMGTPSYMSPEQARGEKIDRRSDIFSLGVVIYEMATGELPFKGKSEAETMNAAINEPHIPAAQFNQQIPAELSAVIDRALSKDPAERYQSMGEMLRDLRQVGRAVGLLGSSDSGPPVIPYLPLGRRAAARWTWVIMLLGLALLAGLGLWFLLPRPSPQSARGSSSLSAGEIKSLAVLPLENLSGDPSQEYFADGMTDALIGELAKIEALRVISRTSAMYYKGTKKTLPQIAGELRVDAVVEGTTMRSGDEIQVRVQLIRVVSDQHLWSETYHYDLRDVLTLQSEAARAIARQIQIKVTPDEQARLATARPVNSKAYSDYLLGLYYWNRRTEGDLLKAIDYFKSAIEQDRTYAPPYAMLGDCYNVLAGLSFRDPRECYPIARDYAAKALSLDETVAEAHTVLGIVKTNYERNREGGEEEHKRAIDLNAGISTVHMRYAMFLAQEGRIEESLAEVRRARELDPVSLVVNTTYGLRLYNARRFDEAIEQFRNTLGLDPNFYLGRIELGRSYALAGRYAESLAELKKAVELSRDNSLGILGYVYAISGRTSQARQVLAELRDMSGRRYVSSFDVASIYAALGEKDKAFNWLEKSFHECEPKLVLLKVEPMLDSLRKDSRFGDLLRRLGLAS